MPLVGIERSDLTYLIDSLEDVPYHLVARPGDELRSETLKVVARML